MRNDTDTPTDSPDGARPSPLELSGRALFDEHYETLDDLCRYLGRRYRLNLDERDDFRSYAMLKLVENDYARLRKYRGDSTFRTYLTVVLQRLFLDYRTHKWGKWRPSQSALRLGPTAVKLETLIYRDGLNHHEAVETMVSERSAGQLLTHEMLWSLLMQLPRREAPRPFEEELSERAKAMQVTTEDELQRGERVTIARALESALAQASDRLSPEERMILKMRFDEGMSVPDIADALGQRPKALYAKISRLLKRLRSALEAAGVDWELVRGLSGSRELELNLERVFEAVPNPGGASV